MAAGLPRQDHSQITTDQLVRFHKNEFDEMPCILGSTQNPRYFKKCPSPALAAKFVGSGLCSRIVFATAEKVHRRPTDLN